MPALETFDVAASLDATTRQNAEGAIKVWEDLDRYRSVIEATKPQVIIECGTHAGGSAQWFAERVRRGRGMYVAPLVISIDVDHSGVQEDVRDDRGILLITGDSTDPAVVARANRAAGPGRRTMVVLDSDHSAAHVGAEIALYGPMVTPGCYLVVEDGIVRWMAAQPYAGSPLDAIEDLLVGSPDWERDRVIETLHPVSMHPAGWWRRA